MRSLKLLIVAAFVFAGWGARAGADELTLRDGTTVEGAVIKIGAQYRVLLADGTNRTIPENNVVSVTRGRGAAAGGPNFRAVKARADLVDAPVMAVTLWEKYIDTSPGAADLAAARQELAKWQKLHQENAERINHKWVGGEDRRRLLAEVDKLCSEAREQLESQTLQAIEKYEKALKLYPNCYEANFALGYYYLRKGSAGPDGRVNLADLDKAITSLQTAVKLRPNSPSALSNLAVGYTFRSRHEEAILTAYQAVKIVDNKPIVENLVNALVRAPDRLKLNNSKVRPIIPEAAVLAQKHGVPVQGTERFHYLAPERGIPAARPGPAGILGNGSGFFVSADGYLITNRHVIEDRNRLFRVRLDDKTEMPAEVVAIDTEWDIALLKIRHDKPLPYLKLAEADLPRPGAPCMVLGYPIAAQLGFEPQVTSGEVSSVNPTDEYQVTLVANTTHGNSGGPIVDRDGNVIGILSAGTSAFNATYLRAVSAGQIRKFLERSKASHTAKIESAPETNVAFDGEKLAAGGLKATVMVMIIRGDGKDE